MIFKGGCVCGAVRYRIDAERLPAVYACHCTDCQTLSGSAFAMQMPVFASQLALDGELENVERQMPSGAVGTAHSCAQCHTRIYAENSGRPGILIVRAGTLDDSPSLEPRAHLWTDSRQPWIRLTMDTINYRTQPADPGDWLRILDLEGQGA